MADEDRKAIRRDFRGAVNMAPKELERWLETDESRSVGSDAGDGEAVGHKMGRRIVTLKRTKVDDYDDDDYAAMKKVIGYVHRHRKNARPKNPETSRWRYSLMNWGHDPLKD